MRISIINLFLFKAAQKNFIMMCLSSFVLCDIRRPEMWLLHTCTLRRWCWIITLCSHSLQINARNVEVKLRKVKFCLETLIRRKETVNVSLLRNTTKIDFYRINNKPHTHPHMHARTHTGNHSERSDWSAWTLFSERGGACVHPACLTPDKVFICSSQPDTTLTTTLQGILGTGVHHKLTTGG